MSKHIASFIVLLITWGFGLTYYLQIRGLAPEDKRVVEVLLLLLAFVLIFQTYKSIMDFFKEWKNPSIKKIKIKMAEFQNVIQRKESQFILVTFPYIAFFETVGFFSSSFIYLLGANILLGTKGLWRQLLIPSGFCLFTYGIFVGIFGIHLPSGFLF